MYINGPGPDRIGLLEFDGDAAFDRTTTMWTLESFAGYLARRVSGTDVTLTEMHVASSGYTDRARGEAATTYRKGRVLLARMQRTFTRRWEGRG